MTALADQIRLMHSPPVWEARIRAQLVVRSVCMVGVEKGILWFDTSGVRERVFDIPDPERIVYALGLNLDR